MKNHLCGIDHNELTLHNIFSSINKEKVNYKSSKKWLFNAGKRYCYL